MKLYKAQRLWAYIIPGTIVFVSLFMIGISFSLAERSVQAIDPPPPLPPFTGETFSAVLADNQVVRKTAVTPVRGEEGWMTVFTDTFEAATLGPEWTAADADGLINGEYYWGIETFDPSPTVSHTQSVWAVGDGADGNNLDIEFDGYTGTVDSWLIYGPLNMEGMGDGLFQFDIWHEAGPGTGLSVATSEDGQTFEGITTEPITNTAEWNSYSYSLKHHAGDSVVYIAFNFTHDGSENPADYPGALVDNVQIHLLASSDVYLARMGVDLTRTPTFTPTPTATPTASPTPEATATPVVQEHDYEFTNSTEGWDMVRVNTNSDNYEILHYSEGYLRTNLNVAERYIILSPLDRSMPIPYRVNTEAQFRAARNEHTYGLVFGADWNGSEDCPVDDFSSCFNTYYLLRVQWVNNTLEYKLQYISGHNEDNSPIAETFIDWETVSVEDSNGFNKWSVWVEEDADIKIYLNGVRVGFYRDEAILDHPENSFFGLMVRTKGNDNANVNFDYVRSHILD